MSRRGFILFMVGAVCLAFNLAAFAYGTKHGIQYYLASFPVVGIAWFLALKRA